MKKNLFVASAIAFGISCVQVTAQQKQEKNLKLDEVVISATKFSLSKEKVGKVIIKITQEQIKNNAGKTVSQLLNNLVGIEVKGADSNQGGIRGTYIRGGRDRQILVLIDGIPVSDPTGINQEFDFRLLSLDQIDSIEVLKGASSSMYGSGAATGVINIILKKSAKQSISGSYSLNLSTNNTAESTNSRLSSSKQQVNINGTVNDFSYLSSLSYSKSSGLSAAKSQVASTVFEEDDYNSVHGLLKLGYRLNTAFNIESTFNYDDFNYDYDGGSYVDNILNRGSNKQLRVSLKPQYTYDNGSAYLLASFNSIKRSLNTSNYEGKSVQLDAVNKYDFSENFQLIGGLNYQAHNNQTDTPYGAISSDLANFNTFDVYATAVVSLQNNLTLNFGGRINTHSNYGNYTVYHINPSYELFSSDKSSLKLLSSYSTAFIAPSLYQLFSDYGNLDLQPETNETFEAGFEGSFGDWIQYNAVYFSRTEENAIIFNSLSTAPWGQYGNANTTIKAKGFEAFASIYPHKQIEFSVGYTYTDKDFENDYIPKNKITASLEVQPIENGYVSVSYRNVGKRMGRYYDATTFQTVEKNLESFNIVDLSANYSIYKERLMFTGGINNIFNEDYEETIGYSTRGRNYNLGLRFYF
ncbi:vitamin B12 transporter BtuB [Polaribacter pacificus]|uniref:Vitamin B12 transporter BtuB n=1 Tax=Polaribacter pacificus TaxID=1775173 RepID=A0A917ME72_9FLAO|nr:TonB-dependent receptor [Polaribacter pacificus]GGG99160.1 vitamin B12 transporter BtuB [Polaribacter pacificus]